MIILCEFITVREHDGPHKYRSTQIYEFVCNKQCLFELFLENTGGTCQLRVASVCFSLTFLLSEAFEDIRTFFH